MTGSIGLDRTVADGYSAARAAPSLNGCPQADFGSLDAIAEGLRNGYVNAIGRF